jgi:hypothetical protein
MPRPCRDVRRGRAGSHPTTLPQLRLHDASPPRHAAVARLWRRRLERTGYRKTVTTRRRRLRFREARWQSAPIGTSQARQWHLDRRALVAISKASFSCSLTVPWGFSLFRQELMARATSGRTWVGTDLGSCVQSSASSSQAVAATNPSNPDEITTSLLSPLISSMSAERTRHRETPAFFATSPKHSPCPSSPSSGTSLQQDPGAMISVPTSTIGMVTTTSIFLQLTGIFCSFLQLGASAFGKQDSYAGRAVHIIVPFTTKD